MKDSIKSSNSALYYMPTPSYFQVEALNTPVMNTNKHDTVMIARKQAANVVKKPSSVITLAAE